MVVYLSRNVVISPNVVVNQIKPPPIKNLQPFPPPSIRHTLPSERGLIPPWTKGPMKAPKIHSYCFLAQSDCVSFKCIVG